VIASELGVVLTNKNKFQTHNWTLRPIANTGFGVCRQRCPLSLNSSKILFSKKLGSRNSGGFFLRNLKVQNKDYSRKPVSNIPVLRISGPGRGREGHRQKVIDTIDRFAATCICLSIPFSARRM
jgi:hypothetical protein